MGTEGGDKRGRTADLLHAMQALYQLSYIPLEQGIIARVTGVYGGQKQVRRSVERDSGAGYGNHQHVAVAATDHLVVDINPDNRVALQFFRFGSNVLHCCLTGAFELLFVGCGPSADDIPDASEEVFENIDTNYGFAGNYPVVGNDALAFDVRGSTVNHSG